MLRIYGQLLDQGSWIDLADGRAALEKAHQLADALLNFGDSRVPWAEGELVVESSDGGDPVAVPITAAVTGDAKATRH